MFRTALSMIALALFTGCGKETFISENIDLKIDFSNQLVLVSFQPITNYHIPVNALIQFQNETRKHSRVFLRTKRKPIGAKLEASPQLKKPVILNSGHRNQLKSSLTVSNFLEQFATYRCWHSIAPLRD